MNIRIKIFMLLFSLFLAPVSIWAIANILSFYTWGFQPISFFDTLSVIYQFVIEKKLIFHFPLYFSVTFFFLGLLAYWFVYCYHILWWMYFTVITIIFLGGPGFWGLIIYGTRMPGQG